MHITAQTSLWKLLHLSNDQNGGSRRSGILWFSKSLQDSIRYASLLPSTHNEAHSVFTGALSTRAKQSVWEAEHPLPSRAKIKIRWSYTSIHSSLLSGMWKWSPFKDIHVMVTHQSQKCSTAFIWHTSHATNMQDYIYYQLTAPVKIYTTVRQLTVIILHVSHSVFSYSFFTAFISTSIISHSIRFHLVTSTCTVKLVAGTVL
jgi:hypothetical protein